MMNHSMVMHELSDDGDACIEAPSAQLWPWIGEPQVTDTMRH
jgi:hypothetical protein